MVVKEHDVTVECMMREHLTPDKKTPTRTITISMEKKMEMENGKSMEVDGNVRGTFWRIQTNMGP